MGKKYISFAAALLMLPPLSSCAAAPPETPAQPALGADTAVILDVGGLKFKDLNKNGSLDAYEDWRLTPEQRADDLLGQMTATEKAAQMVHMTLVTLKENWFLEQNIGFALAYTYLSESPVEAARRANEIQALSERARLGVPAILSMDSVIGASWINGATIMPDQITLAASGDPGIARELADIQRREMLAMGVRMSLSPVADIATDPRWGRVQECFGEDADTAALMVAAAIEGLQHGGGLGLESIIACVKHFPGSGAQTLGVDGSPLVFDDESFQAHLGVFKAAIEAGAAAIMPYGYSQVPYLGGDAVNNYAHESSTVMTDLLRGELGYTGLIQTDWGLNHQVAAQAGADILGGAGQREIAKLSENLSADVLDDRVRRILIAKFELGIFENPYVDEEAAGLTVGVREHYEAARDAASKAITLVKYENAAPLAGRKLIVAGTLAEDAAALSSGWKFAEYTGTSILDALTDKAGAENIQYIGGDLSKVEASYPEDATAIVVVGEKSGTHEPSWGTATLIFPDEQADMVKALKDSGIRVVTVVLMNRAYVMGGIAADSDCLALAYRPGTMAGAEAVANALFGETPITGRTPFQIPANMNQVLLQREDYAKDITDPLYDYGFGIDVQAFGD
ncbi:MAG: glycoside hydrolase family 3 C-terminal domain-containing protein [Oscillospiraceae bacterium]|jgi:beta-glucosidase|nr:glycoside hydrolase family 3 C-terminal domain-containing protein [Oscillospiraceae bacterium]